MRIWDVPLEELCRKHLLGEHRELHALWTILSQDRKGYRSHPETKRWVGKLAALYKRHEEEVIEMRRRGYNHYSDLDLKDAIGEELQSEFVSTIQEQRIILKEKDCECFVA